MDIFVLYVLIISIVGLTSGGDLAPVYVSNGTHILSYRKADTRVDVIVGRAGYRIVGVAADIAAGQLFWSDISFDRAGIYRSDIQGHNATQIVQDVGEVNGLSVDWVSNHVYWTDTERKTIEVANYDGGGRRVLVSSGLQQPRSIVAAPSFGYIFWADQRARRMERAWLDGSHRRVILKSKHYWPNQLAIGHASKRLFWVDAGAQGVYSCGTRGQDVREERALGDIVEEAPGYGLAVDGDTAVVSTWFSTALYTLLVRTDDPVWSREVADLGTRELFSLVILSPSTQPHEKHPCGEVDRGGCSHMCLPTQDAQYHCSCPTYGGVTLAPDGRTCRVPADLLLCTIPESGEVGFLDPDTDGTGDSVALVGRSPQPRAVTYDPVNQVVYWSDLADRAIYRAQLDGTGRATLLNSSQGLGLVHALAFDWRSGRLYFSNAGHSAPTLDGTVYRWRRLEWIHVSSGDRKSLMADLEEPAGVALDLQHGHLYVSDAGSRPRVVRADLDGTRTQDLADAGLSSPGRLVVAGDILYVTDNRTDWARLLGYNLGASNWRYNVTPGNEVPYAVAAGADTLFYTDLLTRSILAETETSGRPLYTGIVGDMVYTPSLTAATGWEDECTKFRCSHGCVQLPRDQEHPQPGPGTAPVRCVCPDRQALVIGADGKTCTRPANFLLLADMTTVAMLSLDAGTDGRPLLLHHGDTGDNIVALTYDHVHDRVYWTEHDSHSIYLSGLDQVAPVLLYRDTGPIDGLVIDSRRQRLYWTVVSSDGGPGFVARLNIDKGLGSYRRLHVNRHSPRTITIDRHGKWLFWTEYRKGAAGSEVHMSKANGHRHRPLVTSGLQWPNSLVAQDDMLFIGDGNGRLLVMDNIQGGVLRDAVDSADNLGHVFGLGVLHNLLVYSDWKARTVQQLNVISGAPRALAANLTRPTALALHHPGDLSDSVCYGPSRPCVDVCLPLMRGQYECLCTRPGTDSPDPAACMSDTDTAPNTTTSADTTESIPTTPAGEQDIWRTTTTSPAPRSTPPTTTQSGDVPDLVPSSSSTPVSSDKISTVTARTTKNYDQSPETMSPDMGTITSSGTTTAAVARVLGSRDGQTEPGTTTATPTTQYWYDDERIETGETHSTGTDSDNDDEPELTEPPSFENCPAGDTIIMDMPDTADVVTYPDPPAAYDANGRRLAVMSSHNVTADGVPLRWQGADGESRHMLLFTATDYSQQQIRCEFVVVLQDVTPPVFTACPDDVLVRTTAVTEFVDWAQPEATDNVGVQAVAGSHVAGSLFPTGETVVNYTATDWAGNQAHCTFNIIVLRDKLCSLPEIVNGGVLCSHGNPYAGECSIRCEVGYVVNPVREFRRPFNCRHPDDIHTVRTTMATQRPCLPRLYPSLVRQEFRLLFQGPIQRHRDEVRAYLAIAIAGHLERERLCEQAVCTMGNLTVPPCGRADPDCPDPAWRDSVIEEEELMNFIVVFNVTISNGSLPGGVDVHQLLGDIEAELTALAPLLQLQLGGHKFAALADSVRARPAAWTCVDGQIAEGDMCIACPSGTLHNRSLCVCQYCRAGEYQDRQGQLACIRCQPGHTSQGGAVASTQCTQIPSMDEMTLFVIVTACSFGVVFLCMAITLYLQFQRQQRRNQKAAASSGHKKTRYNMSPNIYVAPPPILKSKLFDDNSSLGQRTYSIDRKQPIHFFANHDYEAVDQNAMNESVYQNDVSSVNSGYEIGSNTYSPAEEVATGTLTRENTFSKKSPPYGGQTRSSRANTPTSATLPAMNRKLSFDSSFSNYSPPPPSAQGQRTPSSDSPLITQSPLLRLKLAAYNFNSDD